MDARGARLDLYLRADEGLELVTDLPLEHPYGTHFQKVWCAQKGGGFGIEND